MKSDKKGENKRHGKLIEWSWIVLLTIFLALSSFVSLRWVHLGSETFSVKTMFSKEKLLITLIEVTAFMALLFYYFFLEMKKKDNNNKES